MKSNCNGIVCFGFLLLAGGGVMASISTSTILYVLGSSGAAFRDGGVAAFTTLAGSCTVAFVGLFLMYRGITSAQKWNRVVGIAKSQNSVTMKEMSIKSGVSEDKIGPILYEAIASGDLSGTIEGDVFSRKTPTSAPLSSAKVLVVCPYCGAKTEQGLTKCQKCSADI